MRKNKEVFFKGIPSRSCSESKAWLSKNRMACPRAWGGQGRHAVSLLLWMFGSLKGVLFVREFQLDGTMRCGQTLQPGSQDCAGVISHQSYTAEIKLGSPHIQPCPFLQLLVKGFSKIAVISSECKTGSLFLFVEGVSSSAWKLWNWFS